MTLVEKTEEYIVCESSHLTNFAILINPSNTIFAGIELQVIKWITIVGCLLSIVGLMVTIIGLGAFKQIRSIPTNRVHIGLSMSLLIANICLLIGVERTSNKAVCYLFSIAIHFSFLSAFCWMLCEAVNLYLRLVVVFDSYSHMFMKYSIFSVAVPTLIVLSTVIFEFAGGNEAYLMYDQASGRTIYCWLDNKARMVAFMIPLILILIVNFVVFILVMKVLFASKKSLTVEENNKTKWLARLRSTVAVSTLIGLSWILGFFAMGEASFAINVAFALLNSLQGCLLCYLYCFAKTDVVTKWKTCFRKTRNPDSAIGGLDSLAPLRGKHKADTKHPRNHQGRLLTSRTAPRQPFRSNAPTKKTTFVEMAQLTPKLDSADAPEN